MAKTMDWVINYFDFGFAYALVSLVYSFTTNLRFEIGFMRKEGILSGLGYELVVFLMTVILHPLVIIDQIMAGKKIRKYRKQLLNK